MGIARAAVSASPLVVLPMAGLLAAGCNGSSASAPASQSSPASPTPPAAISTAPAAAGTESPPPGDIPDSTVYVPYRAVSGQYVVKVPQGWAQTATAGVVSFTDKLNSI